MTRHKFTMERLGEDHLDVGYFQRRGLLAVHSTVGVASIVTMGAKPAIVQNSVIDKALVQRMPVKDRQRILLSLLANKITVLIEEQDIA